MRGLALAMLALAACAAPREPLAVLPDFTLEAVTPRGVEPFGAATMRGRAWVVDFIYTRCGGPCPLMSGAMAELGKSLPPSVGLLSVSVDPQADTPERLRAYAARYGAEPGRWVFARGDAEQTYRAAYAAFRLPLSIDPSAPEASRATHSTRFVLVDAQGRIRGYYDGLDELQRAALARDARRLLEEGA